MSFLTMDFSWMLLLPLVSMVGGTTNSSSLACYDCSESFKYVWDPYTECQAFPNTAPLRECLNSEQYCKVERTTYREMTVSITRSCTDNCLYGCYASGFGITKLTCTTCCQGRGCNTGSVATEIGSCFEYCILLNAFALFFAEASLSLH